jgi:hypothetical protein
MKTHSRTWRIVFGVMALVALLGLPMATYAQGDMVKVVGAPHGLRLRQAPNLTAPIVLTLFNDETVSPQGGPTWNQGISWTPIVVTRAGIAYEGYCATAYLGNYGGWTPTGEHGLKVTAPAGLRLRSGPSTAYATQRIVPFGAIVQPTGVTQWGGGISWTKVSVDGVALWGATQYLIVE